MSLTTAIHSAEAYLIDRLGSGSSISTLVGDRIYRTKAPTKTDFPCVVFAYQQGTYQKVVGGIRYVTSLLYAVRAITRQPSEVADEVDTIAAAFDSLLENDSASPVLIVECETPLSREYVINGVTYEERGGLYRIRIQGG